LSQIAYNDTCKYCGGGKRGDKDFFARKYPESKDDLDKTKRMQEYNGRNTECGSTIQYKRWNVANPRGGVLHGTQCWIQKAKRKRYAKGEEHTLFCYRYSTTVTYIEMVMIFPRANFGKYKRVFSGRRNRAAGVKNL